MSESFSSSNAGTRAYKERGVPEVPGHQLLRCIASGAYGEVWLALNVMGTYRAIKVVYRGNFSEERPFTRELEGMQKFEPISREHPGLVDILQAGRDEQAGRFYYVMELADDSREVGNEQPKENQTGGSIELSKSVPRAIDPDSYTPKTLRSLLHPPQTGTDSPANDRRCLPVRQCLEIACELTLALDHLHKNKLVHRDIKPSNIIFVNGVAKLADIGLVTVANEQCSFVGTEGFVPHEGPGKVQADIYALGKVLYEMTTGLGAKEYPSLPDEWKSSPDREERNGLNQVILRACDRNVKRRYLNAAQMRSDLDLLISGKSLAIRKLQRSIHRMRWIIAAFVIAGLLSFFIVGFLYFKNRAAEEDRRRVLREIQISQMQLQNLGWFSNNWSRLERAAAIRKDQELLEQATPLLAGWDGRLLKLEEGAAASSAAFAPDGRALVAGAGQSPALLIDTNGVVTRLSLIGEGPVCWTPQNIPLQLTTLSNHLVLRDATTGVVRKQFGLGDAGLLVTNATPILAITPDGERIAAASSGRVFVWNADTGDLIGEVQAGATAIAFALDGSLLGTGDAEGTTRVYSLPNLAEVAVLRPALRGNPITCLAFTRDRVVPYGKELGTNSWLVAAGDQGAGIVVWDLERGMPRSYCRGSTWTVASLAVSPDGLTLASAGRNAVRLWDITSGLPLVKLEGVSSGESTVLNFDATGKRLICGGLPGADLARVALWELYPDHGLHKFPGLASPVRKVWFSRDSELVAALSDDWHLGIWGVNPRRLLFIFETPVGIYADNAGGCFASNGKQFAFSTGQEALLYDLVTSRVLRRWTLKKGLSDDLQWDAQDRLLLLRRERGAEMPNPVWRLYALDDSPTPTLLHEQAETNWSVRDVALPAGGRRFFAWSTEPERAERMLHVYDTASGRELWKAVTERKDEDLRVYLDPRGEVFGYTYTSLNDQLRLVRLSDFVELGTTKLACEAIAPSGKQFALSGWFLTDNTGTRHGIPLIADHEGGSVPVFSPSGRLLAWGASDGLVYVVDTQELQHRMSPLMPR